MAFYLKGNDTILCFTEPWLWEEILTFLRFKSRSFSKVYRGKNDLSSTDHFSFSHEVEISWAPLNRPLTSRFSGSTMFNWKTDLMEKSIHSGGEKSFSLTSSLIEEIWRFFFVFCCWLESVQWSWRNSIFGHFWTRKGKTFRGFQRYFKGMLSHQNPTWSNKLKQLIQKFSWGHFGGRMPGRMCVRKCIKPDISDSQELFHGFVGSHLNNRKVQKNAEGRQFQKIPIDLGNNAPPQKKQTNRHQNKKMIRMKPSIIWHKDVFKSLPQNIEAIFMTKVQTNMLPKGTFMASSAISWNGGCSGFAISALCMSQSISSQVFVRSLHLTRNTLKAVRLSYI